MEKHYKWKKTKQKHSTEVWAFVKTTWRLTSLNKEPPTSSAIKQDLYNWLITWIRQWLCNLVSYNVQALTFVYIFWRKLNLLGLLRIVTLDNYTLVSVTRWEVWRKWCSKAPWERAVRANSAQLKVKLLKKKKNSVRQDRKKIKSKAKTAVQKINLP